MTNYLTVGNFIHLKDNVSKEWVKSTFVITSILEDCIKVNSFLYPSTWFLIKIEDIETLWLK